MDKRKECWIEIDQNDKSKEKSLRNFLLKNSDTLRLTRFVWRDNFFWKKGHDEDHDFIKNFSNLKSSFLRKIENNKRFNDIEQGKRFEHYFFRINGKIKKLLDKETLFFYPPVGKACSFYAFEDPTFYKKGKMVGGAISHENQVFFYLNERDALNFKNKFNAFITD
jgi:hypothetical protein